MLIAFSLFCSIMRRQPYKSMTIQPWGYFIDVLKTKEKTGTNPGSKEIMVSILISNEVTTFRFQLAIKLSHCIMTPKNIIAV